MRSSARSSGSRSSTGAPVRAASSIIGGTIPRRTRTSGRFPRATSPISPAGVCARMCLSRSTVSRPNTTTCSSAGLCFRTRSPAFQAARSICFPGIAAPEIIHFTHWLGALVTSYEVIGTIDSAVRAVINRAAALLRHAALAAGARRHASRRGGHVLRRACTTRGGRLQRCRRSGTSSGSTSRTIACSR